MIIDDKMEGAIVELVNKHLYKHDVYLEKYQKINMYIRNRDIIQDILKVCKFKDVGNIYDYPTVVPQPDYIDGTDLVNYKLFNRIAVSKKLNSAVFYRIADYSINCVFFIDTDYLKKFFKKTNYILQYNPNDNPFRDVDFDCKPKEYIEINEEADMKTREFGAVKKKVIDEHLVFDKKSTLNEVMNDITNFFKEDTYKLYQKLELSYKRGIILYGDPGNGKSAMIREIIRIVPNITKIIINSNVNSIAKLLKSLIKALNGRKAIIIIEDVDSLIADYNRSEFLNALDGVNVMSGIYFIGTTNYPERIDPAFMNRAGRFDSSYKIDNPSEDMRRIFFESRKISTILSEHKVFPNITPINHSKAVLDVFVKNSDDLPMSNLKELITNTLYTLALNPIMSIDKAVKKAHKAITENRMTHIGSFNNYKRSKYSDWDEPYDIPFSPKNKQQKSSPKKYKRDGKYIILKEENSLTFFTPEYHKKLLSEMTVPASED